MQQYYLGYQLRGYAWSMKQQNITQHPKYHIICERMKIITFFDRWGPEATHEAHSVCKQTVYNWKKALKKGGGRLSALAPGDQSPKTVRSHNDYSVYEPEIISIRGDHPRLGKDKLKPLLDDYCIEQRLKTVSASTIGRILINLKQQGRLSKEVKLSLSAKTGRLLERTNKPKLKKQRRGSYMPKAPGDLIQIDTVVKFILGIKRYCLTAIDVKGRFTFAFAYKSPSSANATDFLLKLKRVAPFEVKRVQTDNGSEFYKFFHEACVNADIKHFWNYPRSPKMNAYIERFNRTIQEEFMDGYLDVMADNIDEFNSLLMDWLVWYNTKRPHYSLGQISPMKYLINNFGLSNMLWTHTKS